MLMTILLTICSIILLCLMILTATVFMPYRGGGKELSERCAGGSATSA